MNRCLIFFTLLAISSIVDIVGILLISYNDVIMCDDCLPGFNSTIINDVQSCASIINNTIKSYDQCNHYYIEPGFGIGCFLFIVGLVCIFNIHLFMEYALKYATKH